MIKLIATDMDNTLLDEESRIPGGFTAVLEELVEKNVRMVIASGRPYYTLRSAFGPMADKLSYICDNGALVVHKNKVVYKSLMDDNLVKEIIRSVEGNKDSIVIVCALDGAYTDNTDEEINDLFRVYYTNLSVVDDLTKLEKEVNKVTIYSTDTMKVLNDIINPRFGKELYVVTSGEVWIDITNKGTNKGIGMRSIMAADNLKKEEIMAFGDYYNDIEMLKEAEYSFVMENAPEDMKKHGKYIAESNKDHGVLKAISKYVLGKEEM